MTLEILSRPPVVSLQKNEASKPVLGGTITDPAPNTEPKPAEVFKRSVLLPRGEEITLRGKRQREALQKLTENSSIDAGLVLGDATPTGEMNLERTLVSLRKKLSPYQYGIRGLRDENGVMQYSLVEITDEFELPNGKKIRVVGNRQKDVLGLLLSQTDGIVAKDAYGAQNKQTQASLEKIIQPIREVVDPHGYKIKGISDEDGAIRYTLEEIQSNILTLPNGEIVEDLFPKELTVTNYFIEEGLPIYINTLLANFMQRDEFRLAKYNMAKLIYSINRSLGKKGEIRRVTKNPTQNPAYMLVLEQQGPNTNNVPIEKRGDDYLQERIEKIKNLLDQQIIDPRLTLKDEVNEQLSNELQQLQEETALRRLIEERKRARIEEWNRKQNEPKEDDFVDEPENEYEPIVRFTRIRYLFSDKGLPNKVLDEVGQEALEKAKESFNPENGFSFEEYAEFWIRGTMGNMLLYGSPEAPETEPHGLAVPDESITSFKKDFAIALIDLSSRRRYPKNFITPYESRALDIMRGITGKNPGNSEDVAYEFDSSIQWAERLIRTGMEKLMNSPHAERLQEYLAA